MNEIYHFLWHNMINFIINVNLIITTWLLNMTFKVFCNIINSINKIHKI